MWRRGKREGGRRGIEDVPFDVVRRIRLFGTKENQEEKFTSDEDVSHKPFTFAPTVFTHFSEDFFSEAVIGATTHNGRITSSSWLNAWGSEHFLKTQLITVIPLRRSPR